MRKTSERYTPSKDIDEIYCEHMQRYLFAKDFIQNKDILDIACGSGYGAHFLAKNGARRVVGVDISEEAIRYCKKRYHSDNLSFQVMDATHLRFPESTFQAVVSFETIEHVAHPDSILVELKRVLQPQGTIIISTPNQKVYGLLGGDAHRFHVKELCLGEFKDLISCYFEAPKLYGQRRSEHYEKKTLAYPHAIQEATRKNALLRENPFQLKNLIPLKVRQYLSKKIMNLPFPTVTSCEDLVISEDHLEESKFFVCVAAK